MEITRKELLLVAFVAVLVGVYVCFFTDWFKPKTIHIEHNVRPMGGRGPRPVYVVSFALDREYKLTSVKVVAANDATNAAGFALWHVATDAKSPTTKGFIYGGDIPGLKPFVSGSQPAPLEPNIVYRLVVEAGRIKGEHDFSIAAGTPVNR